MRAHHTESQKRDSKRLSKSSLTKCELIIQSRKIATHGLSIFLPFFLPLIIQEFFLATSFIVFSIQIPQFFARESSFASLKRCLATPQNVLKLLKTLPSREQAKNPRKLLLLLLFPVQMSVLSKILLVYPLRIRRNVADVREMLLKGQRSLKTLQMYVFSIFSDHPDLF